MFFTESGDFPTAWYTDFYTNSIKSIVLLNMVIILQFKTQKITSVQLSAIMLLIVVNIREFNTKTFTSVQLTVCVTDNGKYPKF
jgi:hypothetical protein